MKTRDELVQEVHRTMNARDLLQAQDIYSNTKDFRAEWYESVLKWRVANNALEKFDRESFKKSWILRAEDAKTHAAQLERELIDMTKERDSWYSKCKTAEARATELQAQLDHAVTQWKLFEEDARRMYQQTVDLKAQLLDDDAAAHALEKSRDELERFIARHYNRVTIKNRAGDECNVRISQDGSPIEARTCFDMASFAHQLRVHFPPGAGREWEINTFTAYPVEVQHERG